jgi:hypothetical protein
MEEQLNMAAAAVVAEAVADRNISRDETSVERSERRGELAAEGNIVAACCIFASSIALDALNALPTTVVADVPTSLRTTSLILVGLIGAPPVEPSYLFEQRGLACILLVAASWIGLHHGGSNARIADAIYTLFGGWSAVGLFGWSGPQAGEKGHDPRERRENVVALSAAFLGYAGIRVVRAGMTHATEAISFTMSHEDVTARGIALADDLVAAALVFGGLLCVCAAVFVLSNHEVVYERGCTPICATMGVYSVVVFTAAFVVQIASYARMEDLDVLFNDSSCVGDVEVCSQAFRARRFYSANGSPAVLWACAAGLTLFAFPYDRRCRSRRDYFNGIVDLTGRKAATASAAASIFSALVALGVVFLFSDSTSFLASVEVLLLYFSIPLAWYGESWLACGLHVAGIVVYTATRLGGPIGYDLSYLTHWFVAATLLITVVLAVTTGVSALLYNSWVSKGRYIEWIDTTTAILLVALVSLQLLLSIASLSLGSGYDGARIGNGRTWRQTSFEWTTQHNISFFFAAALVGGRFETQNPTISRGILQTVWFSVPSLIVALWTGTLVFFESEMPYFTTGEPVPLAIATFAALVPWVVVGVVIC